MYSQIISIDLFLVERKLGRSRVLLCTRFCGVNLDEKPVKESKRGDQLGAGKTATRSART
jgi:hypothetical protein